MYDKVVLDRASLPIMGGARDPRTPLLLDIKEKVEAQVGIVFNRVLLNYRDGMIR
jgi:hypothetical protein